MIFDPLSFLDATTTEVNEKRALLPTENPNSSDGLYTVIIGEIKPDSGEKEGKVWLQMQVPLTLDVPADLQNSLRLPATLKFTDRAFVDLTEAGTIDNAPGKNRRQRQYRDATGLNKPGEPFAWRMLTGKVVKIQIKHEMYKNELQEQLGQIMPA